MRTLPNRRQASPVRTLLLVGILPACQLVFGDFDVDVDGSGAGGGAGSEDGGAVEPTAGSAEVGQGGGSSVCGEDPYRCLSTRLQQCVDGQWTDVLTCTVSTPCNEKLGRCDPCKVGDYQCAGQALQFCATGESWATQLTCDADEICDLDLKTCAVCRKGEARCDGGEVTECNATHDAFSVRTPCPMGCVDKDGDQDYCATCDNVGARECSNETTLRTCSSELKWVPQACPTRCVDDESLAFCE